MTEMNRFGLVFGCNMFAALVLQTILTAVVAEKHGLALPAKKQVSLKAMLMLAVYYIQYALVSMTRNVN